MRWPRPSNTPTHHCLHDPQTPATSQMIARVVQWFECWTRNGESYVPELVLRLGVHGARNTRDHCHIAHTHPSPLLPAPERVLFFSPPPFPGQVLFFLSLPCPHHFFRLSPHPLRSHLFFLPPPRLCFSPSPPPPSLTSQAMFCFSPPPSQVVSPPAPAAA